MYSLSFIIPAFNAGSTIQRCLDSVFNLPFSEKEYEVIVIDDCSTDNTVSLIENYGIAHSNLTLIRQTRNHRQGAARNKGIDQASGMYIAFVDSDDTVLNEGIVNAVRAVQNSQADICYYDYEYQAQDGRWHMLKVPNELRGNLISSKEYLENYYTTFYNGPSRTIIKASFLKNTRIRFVEDVRWEDCDWTVKVYSRAEKIQFVDGVGYRYFFNESSTSKQRGPRALSERVYAGRRMMVFGKVIEDTLPRLSETVFMEGRYRYVIESLRFRNLTKYSIKDITRIYQLIGNDGRHSLLQFKWPFWEFFFLRFEVGSLLLFCLACPFAYVGRKLINWKRKGWFQR